MSGDLNLSEFHTLVQVINSVDAGIIVVDDSAKITVWNRFAQAYTGLNSDKVLGERLFDVLSDLPSSWMMDRIQQVITTGASGFSSWENRPHVFPFHNFCPLTGGERVMYQDVTFLPLFNLSGRVSHVCIKINDVSDIARNKMNLRTYNQKLQRISSIDGLTQLFNRRHWENLLKEAYVQINNEPETSAALFICDIDHFKKVNDTYGHQTGDDVIRYVSKEWNEVLSSIGHCGRFGGEEFVAFSPNVSQQQALDLAESLRRSIASHPVISGTDTIPVTISIGLALHSPAIESCDDWLKKADEALYHAKETGRNRVTMHCDSLSAVALQG
ncbi:diguanylate cyclase [Thaumasiovibrio subtropicus]|nr:diguanylate cyclase [Thaumasiovibrio subtropicus]